MPVNTSSSAGWAKVDVAMGINKANAPFQKEFTKFIVCFFCVLLCACEQQVVLKWSEEVELSPGKVIVVKRTALGKKLGEIGGGGGWEQKEMSVDIGLVEGAFTPPIWRTAYVPILLDYDALTKEWRIVATFYTCKGWNDLGRPALPYVEYRVSENALWRTAPLDADLIGRKTNLLTGPRSGGEPPLLTLKDKKTRGTSAADKYRSIVGKYKSSC